MGASRPRLVRPPLECRIRNAASLGSWREWLTLVNGRVLRECFVTGRFHLSGQLLVHGSCCAQESRCPVDHSNDPAGRNVGMLVCESLFDDAQQPSVCDG